MHHVTFTESEIESLPSAMRQVVAPRNDGKRYAEIASELNIPLGTVRSRLNRARAKIAKMRKEIRPSAASAAA